MAVVLGLIVALFYGSADFCGGQASKRAATTSVLLGSFGLSLVLLVLVTAGWSLVGTLPDPAGKDLSLGVGAGAVGPIAVGLLYKGLATGRMSVVAPITAVVAALVPLTWGLAQGERPSTLALGGVALALAAVGLISSAPEHHTAISSDADADDPPRWPVVPGAIGAGFGFGIVFVLLGSTTDSAGLWPLVTARTVAVAVLVLFAVGAARRSPSGTGVLMIPVRSSWSAVAGAGVLDVSANAVYLVATRQGLLSLVAVISSLYPAATVILARTVLGERLHRTQVFGLLLAGLGIAAIAGG